MFSQNWLASSGEEGTLMLILNLFELFHIYLPLVLCVALNLKMNLNPHHPIKDALHQG